MLTNSYENVNRKFEYFRRKHSYLSIIGEWRRKMSIKNAAKARNWTDDETACLCEILVDPINGFLQTFEYKALKKSQTREVFASILQVQSFLHVANFSFFTKKI